MYGVHMVYIRPYSGNALPEQMHESGESFQTGLRCGALRRPCTSLPDGPEELRATTSLLTAARRDALTWSSWRAPTVGIPDRRRFVDGWLMVEVLQTGCRQLFITDLFAMVAWKMSQDNFADR
jgi:hypothetical protein